MAVMAAMASALGKIAPRQVRTQFAGLAKLGVIRRSDVLALAGLTLV